LPPHAPHVALPQATPLGHDAQTVPPTPHALTLAPVSQVETSQHPSHEVPSHTHRPVSQCWPLPHDPSWHDPPQPSSAPHALPLQLGVHPHTPDAPPPPQRSGLAQLVPAQHGWPLPPHTPQSTPHVCPLAHGAQTTPPLPHEALSPPLAQVVPVQQPPHDVASHLQTPATQRCPCPHAPSVQTPSHPLLAPHASPVQLGTHVPAPQTFGWPPPPQSSPMLQPPQSMSCPHEVRSSPHFPAHAAAWVGQSEPTSAAIPASGIELSLPASPGEPPSLKEAHAATSMQRHRMSGSDFNEPRRAYVGREGSRGQYTGGRGPAFPLEGWRKLPPAGSAVSHAAETPAV
jgi:hypothetical protein